MKTKSAWGNSPKRIYNIIRKLEGQKLDNINVCIVGCSDGKFVLPFARHNIKVIGYAIDKVALYGGMKFFPIHREDIERKKYVSSNDKPIFPEIPCEQREIMGLKKRLEVEKLNSFVTIREQDFYRSETTEKFDLVFTSCSIQYKCNRDIGIHAMLSKLKKSVKIGGYLYMDYMMPLEDSHTWKSELFLRTGQIYELFDESWKIEYVRESKTPILELAHVDRPSDHFHRFGYVLARRLKND